MAKTKTDFGDKADWQAHVDVYNIQSDNKLQIM